MDAVTFTINININIDNNIKVVNPYKFNLTTATYQYPDISETCTDSYEHVGCASAIAVSLWWTAGRGRRGRGGGRRR